MGRGLRDSDKHGLRPESERIAHIWSSPTAILCPANESTGPCVWLTIKCTRLLRSLPVKPFEQHVRYGSMVICAFMAPRVSYVLHIKCTGRLCCCLISPSLQVASVQCMLPPHRIWAFILRPSHPGAAIPPAFSHNDVRILEKNLLTARFP